MHRQDHSITNGAPMRNRISRLLSCVSLCGLACNSYGETTLEEVIVEAQKREQNLQTIPVAVTALTNKKLTAAIVKDVFDLQTSVPSLQVAQNQTATVTSFKIRGIGTSSQNFGLESSVGLYVDDAYRSRQSAMINNLLDVSSVEILRGPQGALFGKNTLAGAVLFRTTAPDFDTHNGFVEVTAGNYNLASVSAASSFTVIDNTLALRLAAFTSERDGYVDTLNQSTVKTDTLNNRDREGARLQALYTPNDTFTLRAIIDYAEINEACCAAITTLSNYGLYSQNPATLGQPGTDTLLALLGGTVTQGSDYERYQMIVDSPPHSSNKDRGILLNMTWDLNNYQVKSISSFRRFDSYDFIDSDFSDIALLTASNNAQQESFSQEFRLSFSGDTIDYLIGAYYFEQTIELDHFLYTGTNFEDYFNLVLPTAITSTSPTAPGLLYGIDLLSAFSGGLIAPSASGYPADFTFNDRSTQKHDSNALFGQIDIALNRQWTLSAGLRYTHENKQMDAMFSEASANGAGLGPQFFTPTELGAGALAAGTALAEIQAGAALTTDRLATLQPFQTAGWGFGLLGPLTRARPPLMTEFSKDITTGSVKLSYQPNQHQLHYLSFATGFKSGGTNTDRILETLNPVFDSETSQTLELGTKYESPQRNLRSNLALHYTQVDNYQTSSWTGVAFNLQNAGELETYGLEWELQWAAREHTQVELAYAYTIAEFKQFQRGTCWVATPFHTGVTDPGETGYGYCDRSGDRIDFTPKHFLNLTLQQVLPLSATTELRLSGDYSFKSEMMMDSDNDPLKRQPSYALVNLRATLAVATQQLDLTLWGRNIFDQRVQRTTFNVPIQDGHLMAYPNEPRTVGLTLHKRF